MALLKIGIINFAGLLGQSIRTKAFLKVIGNDPAFQVIDINLGNLSKYDKFKAIVTNLQVFFSLKPFSIKKIEASIQYAARLLDQIVADSKINILQAETSIAAYIWLHSKQKCTCIFDMHGLSYEQRIRQGMINGRSEDLYWKQLQEDVITNCDHIFAVSSNMVDYLANYVEREKITVVTNGGEILPYKASFSYPFKTLFAGIFDYWEKIEDYAEMSNCINDMQFFIMGDGRLKDEILGIKSNLKYLGRLPREKALRKMADFQIGIATSTLDITRQVASPIKVFDYMSVGLPVISPNVGEWSQIIKENKCGVVVEKNEPQSFVESLCAIDKQMWQTFSDNGKQLIKDEYNWDAIIRKHALPVYKQL